MKELIIDGVIGWDVEAREINRQLRFAGGDDVVVRMATPGGIISEGLKIFNAFKNYSGNLSFVLNGVVASMGSVIALARGKENVVVEDNAVYMIHNAQGGAIGDYRDLGKTAKLLDDMTAHVAKVYATASGKSMEEIRTLLDAETYYFGEEIVNEGFAGSMVESGSAADTDQTAAMALAKNAVIDCMMKVKEHEMSSDEVKELSAMVMEMTGPEIPAATPVIAGDTKPKTMEGNKMDLTELKGKHPELYATVKNEGVATERARAKQIIAFRAKFPTMHAVIDEAVAEGHDLMTLNLNIMSAATVATEVAAAGGENVDGVTAGNTDAVLPEMVGGVMTTEEHLDQTSKNLAAMIGLKVK